jgi:hypothetical protein
MIFGRKQKQKNKKYGIIQQEYDGRTKIIRDTTESQSKTKKLRISKSTNSTHKTSASAISEINVANK